MVVPVAGRSLAAVAGGVLVAAAWASAIGTLAMPRRASGWVTRWTDWLVNRAFITVTGRVKSYQRRDRLLVPQAATILIVQIVAWLGLSFAGFALLVWPFVPGGITQAFALAGSSMSGVALGEPSGAVPPAILFAAAASGLVIVAPQIAYLPALYAALSRRETDVVLLNETAGAPAWGPELLAWTHLLALDPGLSTFDTLPGLYGQWERWAVDVGQTHSVYLPLVRFRSSRPLTSWVTALLAVLDSAALALALSPESAPTEPARRCLRSGFVCFRQVAHAMGFDVPDGLDGISLTFEEFLGGVAVLREVDFPIECDPLTAWPDFVAWRRLYEHAAYAVAEAVDAVPVPWSGPRRSHAEVIWPVGARRR
jgi:hypothetical protein